MKLAMLLLFMMLPVWSETKLLLVGGGSRPASAMNEFVKLSGADGAKILIIPWASESTESAEKIKIEFSFYANPSIKILPFEMSPSEIAELKKNESFTGVFFTGGDQNVLMSYLKKYDLLESFKKKFSEGVVFGGTSAGTAIMSDPMLTGESNLGSLGAESTKLDKGLGLLPKSVIVDQHFILRQRFNRLAGLILGGIGEIGIGVDENTSILIQGSLGRIIGASQVMLMKNKGPNRLDIKVLNPNEIIDFKNDEFFTNPIGH